LLTGLLIATLVMAVPSAQANVCNLEVCATAPTAVVRASDFPTYRGYATVDPSPDCALSISGLRCMIAVMASVQAYSWNATSGWTLTQRTTGTRVYVYPFGSGWSWTWTAGTGWLAMRSAQIIITYPHLPFASTCVRTLNLGC